MLQSLRYLVPRPPHNPQLLRLEGLVPLNNSQPRLNNLHKPPFLVVEIRSLGSNKTSNRNSNNSNQLRPLPVSQFTNNKSQAPPFTLLQFLVGKPQLRHCLEVIQTLACSVTPSSSPSSSSNNNNRNKGKRRLVPTFLETCSPSQLSPQRHCLAEDKPRRTLNHNKIHYSVILVKRIRQLHYLALSPLPPRSEDLCLEARLQVCLVLLRTTKEPKAL